MIYLATASGPLVRKAIGDGRLGQLRTPESRNRLIDGAVWAADNGCFRPANAPPWDPTRWWRWLTRQQELGLLERGCLFVSCPDKVGDHLVTAALWDLWLPRLAGLLGPDRPPVAWVAQNGATWTTIPKSAEAVFIGGDDQGDGDWKDSTTAVDIIREAKHRGLHAHVGRVNSERRLVAFAEAGADSVDGTYLAWGPEKNLPRLERFLATAHR